MHTTMKGFISMKVFLCFLLLASLAASMGCSNASYICKLGWHQAHISFHSVPVEEVLADKRVTPEIQEKIRFIQEVKKFGEERLGLKKTKNYSRYYEVDGPILYVVTASQKDDLKLFRWSFPIVGEVTYKGFFTRQGAKEEKKELDEKDFDTYLRPAEAYSTLGWLGDPIFSSMADWDEETLANLILHEMTHATIYWKGKTDFNEQVATFIGNHGAIDFLTERYGADSKEVVHAAECQEDDLLFSKWIDQACGRLSKWYGQRTSREEKLKGREEIFQALRKEFGEMKSRFKTGGYRRFDLMPLNNAFLMAHREYFHRLEAFEQLYESLGRDLRSVIGWMKEIPRSEEPRSYLDRWVGKKGLSASSSPR